MEGRMIEEIQRLKKRLKRAFPNGYICIGPTFWEYEDGDEEISWWLAIEQIDFNKAFESFKELEKKSIHLMNHHHVYNDEHCDNEVTDQAQIIANMSAPWNKF